MMVMMIGMAGYGDSSMSGAYNSMNPNLRSPVSHSQAMSLLPGHPHAAAMMMAHQGMGHPGLGAGSPYDSTSGHGLMDIHAT